LVVLLLIFYDNFEKETILSFENYGFWGIQLSSSAQLSFFGRASSSAQLSSANFFPSSARSAQQKIFHSSAQLFFSKFATLAQLVLVINEFNSANSAQ
jgi:hypothetical protein